ncbi:MAG TPA: thiamine phosphate synthase [Trinickia sp.]|uniref:thiamine phosphate synthase n=1 Tax=Trinickia sp. TaxID=2571163 RepID=UPI002CBC5D18|nr:thiamine phosphate synthase [Trinickia sp.]HTI16169.1 thiamine phosphate synthase [Trinickia sp.]
MSRALAFAEREIFWPPADELIEAAERIRARLGDWPPCAVAWRICLTPPDVPRAGDLIVVADEQDHHADLAKWLAAGAGVIEANASGACLTLDGMRYALVGALAEDWLAAFAGFLDCGFDAHDALVLALAWRDGDEADSAREDAWPVDLARFPRIAGLPAAPAKPFAPCPERLGLYAVMPSAQWVERVLELGVSTVQLRVKDAAPDALAAEIDRSVASGRRHGAQVFINDHWRAAIAAGAYGVHLGQEDLETADLSAIAEAGLTLGLSTHGYYEMLRALHFRPSYLAFGAVFATATKTVATAPQGLARLSRYVRLLEGVVPLVAIGGIDLVRLPSVVATGVGSAAVVSAITGAQDTPAAVAALEGAVASR